MNKKQETKKATVKSASQTRTKDTKMTKKKFTTRLLNTVDYEINAAIADKTEDNKHIGYLDAVRLSDIVGQATEDQFGEAPPAVEAVCTLCEAIMSPTHADRIKKIKAVLATVGTSGGLAMVILAIGTALGWGAGMIATATAFFCGTSILGPIGWATAGMAILTISGYFALTCNETVKTERYHAALKDGLKEAINSCWKDYTPTTAGV